MVWINRKLTNGAMFAATNIAMLNTPHVNFQYGLIVFFCKERFLLTSELQLLIHHSYFLNGDRINELQKHVRPRGDFIWFYILFLSLIFLIIATDKRGLFIRKYYKSNYSNSKHYFNVKIYYILFVESPIKIFLIIGNS